jgi:hypothetical protein
MVITQGTPGSASAYVHAVTATGPYPTNTLTKRKLLLPTIGPSMQYCEVPHPPQSAMTVRAHRNRLSNVESSPSASLQKAACPKWARSSNVRRNDASVVNAISEPNVRQVDSNLQHSPTKQNPPLDMPFTYAIRTMPNSSMQHSTGPPPEGGGPEAFL